MKIQECFQIIPYPEKIILECRERSFSEIIAISEELHEMIRIKNYKNKTKYDFANEKFADFEPLGVVE